MSMNFNNIKKVQATVQIQLTVRVDREKQVDLLDLIVENFPDSFGPEVSIHCIDTITGNIEGN